MSEPNKPTEDQPVLSTAPDKARQDRKMKRRSNLQKIFFGIAIGIMITVISLLVARNHLAFILQAMIAAIVTFFMLLTILILALPRIFNYLIKRYTGKEMDVESVAGDIQKKTNNIADAIANVVLVKADPEVKRNIRTDLPDILHYLIFSRLRSGGLRLLLTVFAAVGGLMGTILLYNQNQLLQAQNRKMDIQTSLMESERRGSQVVLMGNVLEDMSAEIQKQKDSGERNDSTGYELSSSLIGRIAATSQGFMPYKFLQGDTLTENEYSLERGQLLLALVNSQIDSLSKEKIFQNCTFQSAYLKGFFLRYNDLSGVDLGDADLSNADLLYADLRGADLRGANLRDANRISLGWDWDFLDGRLHTETNLSEAYLTEADLRGANLSDANLSEAYLPEADFRGADLRGANLSEANLSEANLHGVDLSDTDLRRANLSGANLSDTDLRGVDLTNANFRRADLRGANLSKADLHDARNINSKMLESCYSLREIQGLPDSLVIKFETRIETDPEEWEADGKDN